MERLPSQLPAEGRMMTNPVRKLSFEACGRIYAFTIDADLQRDKAILIADILADEDIEPAMGNLPMRMVMLVSSGTIRPMGMRRIIEVLAT